MSTPDWAPAALQQFDAVVAAAPGMRARDGQRQMAERVARTFARAQLARDGASAEGEEPERAIAVIEAGTGTGKSLAYAVPAIQMALARGTRVLIATATVALQEQLVHKDLPALAAAMPESLEATRDKQVGITDQTGFEGPLRPVRFFNNAPSPAAVTNPRAT